MIARLIITFFLVLVISPHTVKSETIKVYGTPAFIPLHFEGPDGQPVGFWVDVLEKLSIRLPIKLEQKLQGIHKGLKNITSAGEKALLGVITESWKSDDIFKDFVFSDPITKLHLRFYSFANDKLIWSDLDHIRGRVAVIGTPRALAQKWLEENATPSIQIVPVSSFKEGIERLVSGEADAFLGSEWATRYAYSQHFQSSLSLLEGPIVFSTGMTFAAHHTHAELIEDINEIINDPVFLKEVQDIYFKWIPDIPQSPEVYFKNKLRKNQQYLIFAILFSILLILILISYVLYYQLRQKTKLQTAATLAIRSTLHDLADPLNVLISDKTLSPQIRESAYQHITALMQYHRMLLISGASPESMKGTSVIGTFFTDSVSSLSDIFGLLVEFDIPEKYKNTTIETNLSGIRIILYNILKNCFDHGKNKVQIKINLEFRVITNIVIKVSNHIKSNHSAFFNEGNNFTKNENYNFGFKIIEDIVNLANGSFTTVLNDGFFHTTVKIPVTIKDEDDVKSSKAAKIKFRNTLGLVVFDDSRYTLRALEEECKNLGIKCWALSTIDELIAFCTDNRLSLNKGYHFFIDKNLDGHSGISVIRDLQQEFSVRPENITLMTGEVSDLMVNNALTEVGPIGFVQKPFRLKDYLEG